MNESSHPSPEALASFVDGRLAGEERRAMVAHLDACQDCYEVFAETVRFLGEEEPRGQVLRPPRFAAKRWLGWAAAAAAGVAVAVALPLLWRAPKPHLSAGALVAAVEAPDGAALSIAHWPGWPGGELGFAGGGLTEEAASFQIGVWLVDLGAALRARDDGAAQAAVDGLAKTLQGAGMAARLEAPLEDARSAAEQGRFEGLEHTAAELEAGAERLLDPFHLAFGKWAEAGRLAAVVGDRGFFRSPEFVGFREEIEERGLPAAADEALAEIDALTGGDLGPPEAMDELEEAFSQLIGRSG